MKEVWIGRSQWWMPFVGAVVGIAILRVAEALLQVEAIW